MLRLDQLPTVLPVRRFLSWNLLVCGSSYCHSECPHFHVLIADLNGEASCPGKLGNILEWWQGQGAGYLVKRGTEGGPQGLSVFFLGGSQGSAKGKQGGKEAEILVGVGGQGKPVPEGVRGMSQRFREREDTQRQRQRLWYSETQTGTESQRHKREEPWTERQKDSEPAGKAQWLTQIAEADGAVAEGTWNRGTQSIQKTEAEKPKREEDTDTKRPAEPAW